MTTYNLTNSKGQPIATIPVGVVNTTALPITLVGQGISIYGEYIENDLIRMLEHFANPTPPVNPIEGQLWYQSSGVRGLFLYSNGIWVALGSASTIAQYLASIVTAVDFSSVHSVALFTENAAATAFHPTAILMKPNGPVTATNPPAFNLSITSPGDVYEDAVIVNFGVGRQVYFSIEGTASYLTTGHTVSLNVSTAATGGSLKYDIYLFGFTTAN